MVLAAKNEQTLLPMMDVVPAKVQTVLSPTRSVFDKIQAEFPKKRVLIEEHV